MIRSSFWLATDMAPIIPSTIGVIYPKLLVNCTFFCDDYSYVPSTPYTMVKMILAVDVDYRDSRAYISGVTFEKWIDNNEKDTFISFLDNVNEYIPGQFYLRELPCILRLIEEHKLKPEYIVIDGFVFLDGEKKPGLGKYLFDALNYKVAIIGVAKKPFKGISAAGEVYRGISKNPIYVTSVGIALDDAKTFIRSMHGNYRIPTLLKRVDHICRKIKDNVRISK